MDIVRAAARNLASIAVRHPTYGAFSYEQLLVASEQLAGQLRASIPSSAWSSRDGPRIGVYAEPSPGYVAATWAAWMVGGIAVPLATSHPPQELQYVMQDAGVSTVLANPSHHDKLQAACSAAGAGLQSLPAELLQPRHQQQPQQQHWQQQQQPHASTSGSSSSSSSRHSLQQADAGALIVYTSGTTGRPKGALHTHGSLSAQVQCLVSAWQWSQRDTIVHALPLHHVHGIINALHCAHAVGATVSLLPKFSPAAVWQQLMGGDVSVLMAVPTMYSYLLSHYEQHMSAQEQEAARAAAAALRLAVSGSAAAPVPLLQHWQQLSGQVLLERYGMTETGMILSNPYEGERRPGFVGAPLPGVTVKVVPADNDSDTDGSSSSGGGQQGELAVSGPMLFREYWGRPDATAAAFDADGYFLTGDTVALEGDPLYFKVLGRTSVDIIKCGGFKLSALDVESALLQHPGVAEAAVLGAPDEELGQLVTALVVVSSSCQQQWLVAELQELCARELPSYSVPRRWLVLDSPLPRNAMGKVNKKQLLQQFVVAEEGV